MPNHQRRGDIPASTPPRASNRTEAASRLKIEPPSVAIRRPRHSSDRLRISFHAQASPEAQLDALDGFGRLLIGLEAMCVTASSPHVIGHLLPRPSKGPQAAFLPRWHTGMESVFWNPLERHSAPPGPIRTIFQPASNTDSEGKRKRAVNRPPFDARHEPPATCPTGASLQVAFDPWRCLRLAG